MFDNPFIIAGWAFCAMIALAMIYFSIVEKPIPDLDVIIGLDDPLGETIAEREIIDV